MKNVFQRVRSSHASLAAEMGIFPSVLTEVVWALVHQAQLIARDEIVMAVCHNEGDYD